jgi:chromate transporter
MGYALEEAHRGARVTLPELFVTFLKVSLCGFGGPIVWARRFIVERRHWLSDQEFADLLGLCQFLPGPNVASITVCLGSKLRGPAGALAALAGFIVIPWSVGFALGALYLHFADIGPLKGVLRGVSAVGAGLIMATGLRLLKPHRDRPIAVLFAALAFLGLAMARLPLLLVVVALAPLSIAAGRTVSANHR